MASLFSSAKTWSCSTIPNLANKVYVVTGGTAGIGYGIVSNLLSHKPQKIYMISEQPHHAELAEQDLAKYGDPSLVEYIKCDLRDLKEVDRTAKKLKELRRIDALVCNAGVGVGVYNESKDGIDTHFQINHLSQMHLVLSLLPNLLKTAQEHHDARVVCQSSELHAMSPSDVKFESLEEINKDIGPSYLYNRSKLAQILFIRGLVQRLNDGRVGDGKNIGLANLFCNATNPGAVSTGQQDQLEEAYGTVGKIAVDMGRPFMKDPITDGCLPALYAATAEEIKTENITGQYIAAPNKVTDPSKQAQDQTLGENLWKLSEKLLKEKLGA